MGIFDALTTAVTGMQAQSYALQNISGNIANSQTTAYKRTDTTFEDLMQDAPANRQTSGSVSVSSQATNTVQGNIQSAAVGTFMAINGEGYFVVEKPGNFTDGRPVFDGINNYTRRGDFQPDKSGYLVNGAGYYLMGIPIDATTGNLTGSVPQLLQFQNDFLPAQATNQVDYRANLASYPMTPSHDVNVAGSELLNPANFAANPLVGASAAAKITGINASLTPDAAAVLTGSVNVSAYTATASTLQINGQSISIAAGDDITAIINKINAPAVTALTGVTASLDTTTGKLKLTSANAKTAIDVGNASTLSLLTDLGMSVGQTQPVNLLTQSAAAAGQTLSFTVGNNPPYTMTFGTGAGQVSTLADLNGANGLAGLVTAGYASAASVDPATGNIKVTAADSTATITVGGTVAPGNFGMHTTTALPAKGAVVGNDVTTFLNSSVSGGAVTAYDASGSPVDLQLRWAKVSSTTSGGTDTWNLFYQTNSKATGQTVAWQNAGVNYTFGSDGQMSPLISSTTLANVTVDGTSLGNLQINHGSGGLTQFSDSNGNVQVNLIQQNGFAAGELKSIAVNDKGRVVGSYSNGRNIDLAQITLANFNAADGLKRLDGGAFAATDESGAAILGAQGKIAGSSLENSNTDIADEFSKLIVTQQAYSANTRIITTGNQMIQDLLNIIR